MRQPTTTASARPVAVTTAFRLGLLVILLGIIGNVTAFLPGGDDLDAQVESTASTTGVGAGQLFVGITTVTLIALFIEMFLLFKMRDGANWARILITIFTAVQIVAFAVGLPGQLDGADSVSGVVQLVLSFVMTLLGLIILFLMYSGVANRYFQRS